MMWKKRKKNKFEGEICFIQLALENKKEGKEIVLQVPDTHYEHVSGIF